MDKKTIYMETFSVNISDCTKLTKAVNVDNFFYSH